MTNKIDNNFEDTPHIEIAESAELETKNLNS